VIRYRICFVCMGNICRSPTAEGVMREMLARAGLGDRVALDSAGTGGWHVGELPDPQTREAARRRGLSLDHRARQFVPADFDRFDLLLAMDHSNLRNMSRMASSEAQRSKLRLFRSFDAASPDGAEVPDPWGGSDDGFETVLDVCEAACRGLVEHVREVLARGS
jgi:protein-tyrosine phosphatase